MSVGVIGVGYVGLPLAVAFAEAGESVVAIDIDEGKVAAIIAGESYVEDISSERLRAAGCGAEHRGVDPFRAAGAHGGCADLRADTVDDQP
jgi:UDP-N-acetyl-D-glucosamine dehydrogenase